MKEFLDVVLPLCSIIWMFGRWLKHRELYMLLASSLAGVLVLSQWPFYLEMPLPFAICCFVASGFLIYETKRKNPKGFSSGYIYAITLIVAGACLLTTWLL